MKKILAIVIAVLVLGGVGYWVEKEKTKVGFVNYQDQSLMELELAKDNFWIEIGKMDLKESDFSECKSYDLILLNHIGHLTKEQKTNLENCIAYGVAIHVTLATSPDYKISSFEKEELEKLMPYMRGVGKENQRQFLNYVRRVVDGKSMGTMPLQKPETHPTEVFYRIGPTYFEHFEDYLTFYKKEGLYKKERPFVIVMSAGNSPQTQYRAPQDALILALEKKGYNVVSIAGWKKKLANLKTVNPVAIVNMPHGRLDMMRGEEAVAWLKEKNVLYFTPQHVSMEEKVWRTDQRGLAGGMLGQNIVVPEIDGGIDPYVVSVLKKNEKGFLLPHPLKDRVEKFTGVVDRWITMREKPNHEKKAVIIYYKGAGKNALGAGGLEVGKSLLSILGDLKSKGWDLGDLPNTEKELLERIQREGSLFSIENTPGAFENYLQTENPAMVSKTELEGWLREELPEERRTALKVKYGEAPGNHYVTEIAGEKQVVIPHLKFGNVYLMPLMPAALAESEFAMLHGVETPPPYSYVSQYLWVRKKIKADFLFHMGAHGSVEFIPGKQNSLSEEDWAQVLTYPIPHLYIYSVDNIGEAMMAKRRSHATMLSHLVPAMSEAEFENEEFKELDKLLCEIELVTDSTTYEVMRNQAFGLVHQLRLFQDLGWEKSDYVDFNESRMKELHEYFHHLREERIPTGLHVFGENYTAQEVKETVEEMVWPALHKSMEDLHYFEEFHQEHSHHKGAEEESETKHREEEINYVRGVVQQILSGSNALSFMKKKDAERLRFLEDSLRAVQDKEDTHGSKKSFYGKTSAHKAPLELVNLRALKNNLETVKEFEINLKLSGPSELESVSGGTSGAYIHPSSGGDVVGNPEAAPTGKNLYGIDAEKTPSAVQWEVGQKLAKEMLRKYQEKHGNYPNKMSFSLWGGEFIRNQGMNVAQILYMLGAEPVRNKRGRVYDVKLIPAKELGRPRIDVVVQTSGQFRDIGGSRIEIVQKAIALASEAKDTELAPNFVRRGNEIVEKELKEQGVSPLEARRLSQFRVFGGLNGSYGTGIMGLVENGEKWETQEQIANQYINNMGAVYNEKEWGNHFKDLFKMQLRRTDVVVHPRSSNATGPLSLDHVYEFMGGLSAAVQQVTGKDPEAYFNDNRNRYNPKVQGLKEGIWTEARTTILNKKYIAEWMKEGPSAAEGMAENFRNTYGWNATKPSAIDSSLWHSYYDIYVKDSLKMGVTAHFEKVNPYAFQEMTGVMLETIRKGLWKPSEDVVAEIAKAHAESIEKFKAGCSEFVCGNPKLKGFIQGMLAPEKAQKYAEEIERSTVSKESKNKSQEVVLEKVDEIQTSEQLQSFSINLKILCGAVAFLVGVLFVGFLKKKR